MFACRFIGPDLDPNCLQRFISADATRRHTRIQEFSSGDFFSPQLILQKSNGQFRRNLSFFKVPEGVQLFPGGGSNFFQGGGGGPIAYSL